MELLAPAGSPECLKIAVKCGANAVYLGGVSFNARASACNFNQQQLQEAFDYCHTHNVKAYVTLNTLLYDNELLLAYKEACKMASMGADAFIVQDIGLLSLLKNNTNFELHASTQMSIHNKQGVIAAMEMGCKRIVLARETPLKDIIDIKRETKAELEMFIHGALCIGFSGQCLFSSLAGGRSGNRGKCAQACRLPYSIIQNEDVLHKGYLLSPKDLCTIEYLRQICNANVDSLKIEGRLKRPEYVGIVTKQYREALDAIVSNLDFDSYGAVRELASIFNRGGFTKGYYLGNNDVIYSISPNNTGLKVGNVSSEDGKTIITDTVINKGDGVEIRKNGTSLGGGAIFDIKANGEKLDSAIGKIKINSLASRCVGADIYRTTNIEQINRINAFSIKERQIVGVKLRFVQKSDVLELYVNDNICGVSVIREYSYTEGNTGSDIIKKGLEKLGGTQYYAQSVEIIRNVEGYIPQGIINSMRREAVEKLNRSKTDEAKTRAAFKELEQLNTSNCIVSQSVGNSVFAYNEQQLRTLCADNRYKRVYYKPFNYNKKVVLPTDRVNEVFFVPFDISFSNDMKVYSDIKIFDGIYAENLFAVELARELQMKCIAGMGLNVLNCETAIKLTKMGCHIVTISCEATAAQIKAISQKCSAEIVSKGRLPMMKLVCCPARHYNMCAECDGGFALKDRKSNVFDMQKFQVSDCRNILLNCVNVDLVEEAKQLGVGACDLNNSVQDANATKAHFKRGV